VFLWPGVDLDSSYTSLLFIHPPASELATPFILNWCFCSARERESMLLPFQLGFTENWYSSIIEVHSKGITVFDELPCTPALLAWVSQSHILLRLFVVVYRHVMLIC
jgi:hypothetical protein